jgi:Ca-activated chloride channel family protein
MGRPLIVVAVVGLMSIALPASAQFQAPKGDRAWADEAMMMANIQHEPEISAAVVLDLAADASRPDHVRLAKAVPEALAAYLREEDLADSVSRREQALDLGDFGLPVFESADEVTEFGKQTESDAMICGDIALVGDATRVRLVLAEIDQMIFYPPINVYCSDPTATEAIQQLVCRAMRSLLKAEDLQKELKDAWEEPGAGALRFEARPNLSRIQPGQPATLFVRLEFAAGEFEVENRSPLNVAIVLDRSGSMSGEKIEQAKQAAIRVVEGLQASDRVAFVFYNHEVETPIPSRRCSNPRGITRIVENLDADGYTNLGGGLREGYKQARESVDPELVSRTILISDGLANRGETDPEVLSTWARRQYEEDLSTSTIGIGTDYDAALMEKIAVAGNGGYYYVQTPESINDIIAREFGSLFATVAEGSELSLDLMAGAKLEKVFGFEVREEGGAHLVDLPTLRSRDRKFLIAKLSVPALEPGRHEVARARIDFQDALHDGQPATVDTALTIEATNETGPEDIDWQVQLDVEELATADTMTEIAERLNRNDQEGAIALIHGRILELAGMSLQTMDLRSQVQCNILDGLIALIEEGTDLESLRYAANNAQSIGYGGLNANMNYQGLGAQRGVAAGEAMMPGMTMGGGYGGFGGKRQQ